MPRRRNPAPRPAVPDATRPVREYACPRCAGFHAEGLDAMFGAHILFAAGSGVYLRAPRPVEILRRVFEHGEDVPE